MSDFLLVLLYYFSLFIMTAGIWMIISTVFSKDKSMGSGAIIGVISILLGILFLTISTMSEGENKIQSTTNNSETSHPVPTLTL